MKPLQHFAEPFSPTGSAASEGVLNQLGRPKMGPLEVLVRESVQNCWDAKADDSTQVRVEFALVELTADQSHALAEVFFKEVSPALPENLELRTSRRLLLISDRGTNGLGGVIRADREDGHEPRDFVDFMRNVGQPPDTERGGGTYGYGKVALYLASRFRTLIVHTRCRHGDGLQTRLMAAKLGDQFTHNDKRYTGRHWWGRYGDDEVIDPVLDAEAARIAQQIQLPGFVGNDRGTTIAIAEPDFGGLDDAAAMRCIADAIAWNFWPKMVGLTDNPPPMTFAVRIDDLHVPVPDLDGHPVLSSFKDAFLALKGVVPDEADIERPDLRTRDIMCGNPIQRLGKIALKKFPLMPSSSPVEIDAEGDDADLQTPGLGGSSVHHTALLRFPELVVKYLPGPASATPTVHYAGVFLAEPDLDRVFAKSEPPTHDDWVPDGLDKGRHKTFIRVTERRIQEAMKDFSGASAIPTSAASGPSLGFLGDKLSGLLPGIGGPSARAASQPSPPSPSPRPPTPHRPRVRIEGDPILELSDGMPIMSVKAVVTVPDGIESVTVHAMPYVVLEGGSAERDPPAGARRPEVISWRTAKGAKLGANVSSIALGGAGEHVVVLAAVIPDDAEVELDISVTAG